MSKSFKIILIVGLLVLLAPRLVLFLASISLILLAIPIVGALVYFGPTLWKIWQVRNIAKDLHGNMYAQRNKTSTNTKNKGSSSNKPYVDLDKDDYSVVDEDSSK